MRKALLWLLLPVIAGCANPEFRMPRPFRQGPAREQRINAQHFDPYPTDAGGGDILGGRPEDYNDQIPEPARSRWTLPKFLTRRPVPPPMVAPSPGPALAPPTGAPVPQYPTTGYPSTGYPSTTEAPAFSTGGAVSSGGYAPAFGS
jgi:hypothetical protein